MRNRSIDISDLGAVSNITLNQTEIIQNAIDYIWENGGGIVIIPSGDYLIGDIRLRSNVTLYLKENARLIGSKNPMDYFNHLKDKLEPLREDQVTNAPYVHLSTIHGETEYVEIKDEYRFKRIPASRWNNAIIRAIDAENIKIIGEKNSCIEGSNCYDEQGEENYRGPHAITFFNCKNIELKGYTVANSANWAHNLLYCDNISADGITVNAGHDGFDASVCKNLTISNSSFFTGDDCIAGFGNVNVLIDNCSLNSSCSALRFGGTNVMIQKCHIFGPGKYGFRGALTQEEKIISAPSPLLSGRNNMLSAFTYYADYSLPIHFQPGNIVVSDCKIENADRFLHYNFSGNEIWQRYQPLKDITFRNIDATGINMPLTAYGDKNVKFNLTLENINIAIKEGFEKMDLINACNFETIKMKNVKIKGLTGDCLIRTWSDGNIISENVDADKVSSMSLKATESFFADSI